jgi:hypothetical protein
MRDGWQGRDTCERNRPSNQGRNECNAIEPRRGTQGSKRAGMPGVLYTVRTVVTNGWNREDHDNNRDILSSLSARPVAISTILLACFHGLSSLTVRAAPCARPPAPARRDDHPVLLLPDRRAGQLPVWVHAAAGTAEWMHGGLHLHSQAAQAHRRLHMQCFQLAAMTVTMTHTLRSLPPFSEPGFHPFVDRQKAAAGIAGALRHLQPGAGAHAKGQRRAQRRRGGGPGQLCRVPAQPPAGGAGPQGGAAGHPLVLGIAATLPSQLQRSQQGAPQN